jgi:hypothetical protein
VICDISKCIIFILFIRISNVTTFEKEVLGLDCDETKCNQMTV